MKKSKYYLFIYILIMLSSVTANAAVFDNIPSLKQYVDSELEKRSSVIEGKYTSDSEELKMYLNNLFNGLDYYKNSIYSYKYNYHGVENNVNFEIEINHFVSPEEELYANNKVDEIIAEIIEKDMNIHEKIKAVHDWIILNSEYDTTAELRSHYDILSKGRSVCQGYALIFDLFMNKLDIPVKFVTGEAKSFNHIWNMVKADGYWYHIDLTFDDPVPDRDGYVSYDFYMKTTSEILKTHKPDLIPVKTPDINYENHIYSRIINSYSPDRYITISKALNFKEYEKYSAVNDGSIIKVMINSRYLPFNENYGYPYIDENNRTQVPFRIAAESIGASVFWDSESKTASARKNEITVKIPIGTSYIYKNNEQIENDTFSVIKNGRTYLPIRIVMEAFGYDVDWNQTTGTVIIN